MKLTTLMGASLSALLLASCAATSTEGLAPAEAPLPPPIAETDSTSDAINAALLNENRRDDYVERDAVRKPEAVIEYMGIEPGDSILELEAGGGYFTQIFSYFLGEDGKVYMQNPAAFDSFFGDDFWTFVGTMENVEYVKTDFDKIPLEDNSVDAVTWFQGPHELWYTPEGGPIVSEIDAVFPEIYRVLKPGGAFYALDHTAPAGAPATTGGDTHRIDPQIVKDMAATAGFTFAGETELFANPDDDLDMNVFDESVRGKTDQFFLKFEKPAG